MKKIIADNQAYSLSVSTSKNRAYLKLIGFWRNTDAVPEYLNDWKKALEDLKPGFSILTDASEMKTHPQDVKMLHAEAQKLTLAAGLAKVAEIIQNDITEFQLDSLAQSTNFPKRSFKTAEEAETWLDSLD
jgi:hypothetical protein